MKFFDYLDDTYASHAKTEFSPKRDGVLRAAGFWINASKRFYMVVHVPVLLFKYTAFHMGIGEAPINPIKEAQAKMIQEAKKVQESIKSAQEHELTPQGVKPDGEKVHLSVV